MRQYIREKEFWLLILIGVFYFYRPLFLGESFFFRDLHSYFLPQKQLLTDFFTAHELPLWDPYEHGGQAYLPNIANGVLYPLNLLYLGLPLLKAFNFSIVLHVMGCAACAYLFARLLGLQPVPGFITGVIYGFCGYALSLINVLNFLIAMTYLPLMFVCWHRYMLEKRKKWFSAAVLVGVLQVLPGAPEINVITLGSLLGWTLLYPYARMGIPRRMLAWLALGICIVGLAAVQLLPAVEIVAQSRRGHGLGYGFSSHWSMSPRRLPEMVFPGLFGSVDTARPDVSYWGATVLREGVPYLLSIYLGWIVVVLVILGGISRRHRQILPFRLRISCFALCILAVVFSFGGFLPFFEWLHRNIPLIALFRFPVKFSIAGIFPCALLAGYASEIYFAEENVTALPRRVDRRLMLFWGIAVLWLGFTGLFLLSDNIAKRLLSWYFQQPATPIMHARVGMSLAHAAGVWLFMTLLFQYRRIKPRVWQPWLLAGMLVVDLLAAGKRVNPYVPEEFFTTLPPVVQTVRQEIGEGRLFRPKTSAAGAFFAPTNHAMWSYRLNFETLDYAVAALFRIPVIFHPDLTLLAPVELMQLTKQIYALPWERRLPLLSAGNVSLILTPDELVLPGIRRLVNVPNRGDRMFYLYRNETAAARVTFVTDWKVASSDDAALDMMLAPAYDPRQQVILQHPEPSRAVPILGKYLQGTPSAFQDASEPSQQECAPAAILNVSSNTHSARLSVLNPCDGYVVFAEPLYPGWRVFVDGTPVPVWRANYAFSAIFVQAGQHHIKREYLPHALLVGAVISGVFGVMLAVGGTLLSRRNEDTKGIEH